MKVSKEYDSILDIYSPTTKGANLHGTKTYKAVDCTYKALRDQKMKDDFQTYSNVAKIKSDLDCTKELETLTYDDPRVKPVVTFRDKER